VLFAYNCLRLLAVECVQRPLSWCQVCVYSFSLACLMPERPLFLTEPQPDQLYDHLNTLCFWDSKFVSNHLSYELINSLVQTWMFNYICYILMIKKHARFTSDLICKFLHPCVCEWIWILKLNLHCYIKGILPFFLEIGSFYQSPRVKELGFTIFESIQPIFSYLEEYQ